MRIVHLAAGAGVTYCGACARDAALVRGLLALGHDVQVIPLYTPLKVDSGQALPTTRIFLGGINAYLQQLFPLFQRTPEFIDRLLDHPALLRWASRCAIRTRGEDLGPMTISVLRGKDGRQSKELRKLLRYLTGAPRPDVVSITNSLLLGIAVGVKNTLGVPIVCTVQGEDAFVMAMPEPYRSQARQLMQEHATTVDLFISPSEAYVAIMAAFLDVPRNRFRVVHAGVDVDAYRPAAPRHTDPFTIGYLSGINPAKGLDLLVEAFRLLVHERQRDVRLRVAGKALDADYWRTINRRIRSAGLVSRFEYCGEVDFTRKRDFLHACSLFSVPSRAAEPRGIAALEAMAAGVPAVLPDAGVFPEMVALTGGGVLFPLGDATGLAAAIVRLMDNPESADSLGRAGAEGVARHYATARMAEEMQQTIAGLVSGITCVPAPPE
ncbi:MAG: glycosyltransferase family 4 protein [Armatimonadetes bacterium]|nr:glycosyltransferase family 4 protein [Armatimonadota bacterium]